MIYVAAGHLDNANTTNQLNFTIADTFFHPEYLEKRQKNDIALIKLVERLPVSGVTLVPVVDSTENCSVIIRNHAASPSDYFKLASNLRKVPINYCPAYIAGDDNVYCSQYPLDDDWCKLTEVQVATSGDLGSALICNQVFMGILSEIQFPYDQLSFSCLMPRMTFAWFTSLDEHKSWMYKIMGRPTIIPTDPDIIDEHDAAVSIRQATGVLMITVALYIFFYM